MDLIYCKYYLFQKPCRIKHHFSQKPARVLNGECFQEKDMKALLFGKRTSFRLQVMVVELGKMQIS